MLKTFHSAAALGLLGLGACQSAGQREATFDSAAGEHPVFLYLVERYDSNQDGLVAPEEYDRQEGQFGRWDLDGDGMLSAADWTLSGPQGVPRIRHLAQTRMLGRYFQSDSRPESLAQEEVRAAFAAYDRDGDGILVEEEFVARADKVRLSLPGDGTLMMQAYTPPGSPWVALTRVADMDDSGGVALEELVTVFDVEAEPRFDLDHCDGAAPGQEVAALDAAPIDALAGLPVGELVPEALVQPLGGGEPISLRDASLTSPVALIFGSYT